MKGPIRHLVALVAAAAAATIPLASIHAAAQPSAPLVPATGALFGAYVDPDASGWSQAKVDDLETALGRRLAIDHHYYAWTDAFPTWRESWDASGGRIPLITWEPWGTTLGSIAAGNEDSLIRARARALESFGSPVFLRWGHEMNGNWYPWDGSHNNDPGQTNGPAKFVAAWRHVHDLFAAEGASNVVWVWAPNAESVPSQAWNSWTSYYPGNAYVDWVGIDGYNWGTSRSWSSWRSFSSIVGGVYATYAGVKPIMVSETSSAEQGGDKAGWISAAMAAAKSSFPSIRAFVWFHVRKEADWRANSSSAAFAAYRAMGADSYFGGSGGGASLIDTRPPQTSLTSPVNGASVSRRITVSAAATDQSGVASVRFLLDRKPFCTDTTRPYSCSVALKRGGHVLGISATDTAGNTASASARVTAR